MSFFGFILISLIMLVLVYVSFWLKMPQSSVPLFVIYIIFLISHFLSNNNDSDVRFSSHSNSQIEKREQDNKNKTVFNSKSEKSITPKPLVFKSDTKKKVSYKKSEEKKNKLETVKADDNKNKADLELKNIQICRNISQRNPIGADVVFMNDVDSLYCYTRIKNLGEKSEVKHVWYFEDNIMTQVRYNVKKSNIYRSWTKKTILPNQVGSWRVDVQDYNGKIIGSKKFQIKRPTNQE